MVLRFSHDFVRTDRLMAVSAGPHPLADVSELPRIDNSPISTPAPRTLPTIAVVAGQQITECRPFVRERHVLRPWDSSLRLGRFRGDCEARAASVTAVDDLASRMPRIEAATDE